MTEPRLNFLRHATTWGGWVITLTGVIYNLTRSNDRVGPFIALAGVTISGIGHLVGIEVAKRQKDAKKAAEARISGLEESLDEAITAINDPHLKRLVADAAFDDYLRNEVD